MNKNNSLRQAREFVVSQGGQVAPLPISEEELNPAPQDDLTIQVFPLEPTGNTIPVEYDFPRMSGESEFSFFEDGKQRTIQIGYLKTEINDLQVLVPVHYVVVSAVILQRKDGDLRLWNDALIEQGILVEKSLVPNQKILAEFEDAGVRVFDTQASGGDWYELRRRALQQAKKMRLELEDNIIGQWRESREAKEHFLIVDGTLMNFRNEKNVERCIGVSKSFGSRYFELGDHNRILQMPPLHRSWLFRFHSPDQEDDERMGARERISWYLRLRSKQNADPEFGLVRVEISKKHEEQSNDLANRFSRSLISERLPAPYPTPRWDKHLYPIKQCEDYLSSVMPSISTINASMSVG